MTNPIEEMMKTAEVNGEIISCDKNCPNYKFNTACYSDNKGNIPCPVRYPDFTAEKQLEIIKLLSKKKITIGSDDGLFWFNISGYYPFFKADFTQALARLTLDLMNDEELDKSKVKEILEQ